MSTDSDWAVHFDARLRAHEHLLKQLIVTILAGTNDPLETFEGFQRRISAPLKRRPAKEPDAPDTDAPESIVREVVDWIVKGVHDELSRALAQVSTRRK